MDIHDKRHDAAANRRAQPKGKSSGGISPKSPVVKSERGERVFRAPVPLTAPKQRAGRVDQVGGGRNRKSERYTDVKGRGLGAGVSPRAPKVTRHQGERYMPEPDGPNEGQLPEPQEIDQYSRRDYAEGKPRDDYDETGEYDDYEADDKLIDGEWHYVDIVESGENIVDLLPESKRAALGHDALHEYEIDDGSRNMVMKAYDKAMKAARAESKAKNFPFTGAANVRYPLLTTAANQFAARAYPAIVNGSEVVKARIVGQDPDGMKQARATRISQHMSYQCIEEMPEWEKQFDEMLHHLPLAGTAIRCIYYDDEMERNCSELVTLKDFVVNNDATSLEDCPRFTRVRRFYPYEIKEKMATGFYRDVQNIFADGADDSQKMREVLEQHRLSDLDGDGIDEPYIVTIDKESQEVLRVVASADLETIKFGQGRDGGPILTYARHEPMYVAYRFMPDPEGGFHGIGLGRLLEHHGEAINTILNQIIDSATLQNAGGGFLGGDVSFGKRREIHTKLGEWKQLKHMGNEIRNAIVPHQHQGPSPVLFSVLELLVESGKEIGSIKDVLSGDASGANMPVGTTMALIEQGLQQFTAIYKRIYRAMKAEYKLLYRLNSLYLGNEVYFSYHDDEKAIARLDYELDSSDVLPASDASAVTSMQRMSKAEFAMQFKGQPHIDSAAIDKRAMQAAGIEDIEDLFVKSDPQQQQMQMQAAAMEMAKMDAEIAKLKADAQNAQAGAFEKVEGVDVKKAELALRSFGAGAEAVQKDYDEDRAEMMPPEQQQQQPTAARSFGGGNGQ